MPSTSHGLVYPLLTDDANGPLAIQNLADSTDTVYGKSVANVAALPAAGAYAGQRVFLLDTFQTAVWNGATWEGYWKDYTATLVGFAGAVTTSKWLRVGKLVTVEFLLTASGTATADITISTPSTAGTATSNTGIGTWLAIQAAVPTVRRSGTSYLTSSTKVGFLLDSSTTGSKLNPTVPWTWANGDVLGGVFQYREA